MSAKRVMDVFDRCEDCGKFINPRGAPHACRAHVREKLPADTAAQRQARIDADDGDPRREVLTMHSGIRKAAYHRVDPDADDAIPACRVRDKARIDWVPATRRVAQRRGCYPCADCYPEVAERAYALMEAREVAPAGGTRRGVEADD